MWHLAHILPAIAVAVRRLHDTDRSGWWLLAFGSVPLLGVILGLFIMESTLTSGVGPGSTGILGIVFVGILFAVATIVFGVWYLVIMVKDSQPGENRYGPNPKGIPAAAPAAFAPDEQSKLEHP